MNRERRKLFLELATEAIASGDLDSIEEILRLDQQSQPEDSGKPGVKFVFKYTDDEPDDPAVSFEPSMPELTAGQERLLLESGPTHHEKAPDAPESAERPAAGPVAMREPQSYEDLTEAEREEYARDGWRSAPGHLRPHCEGLPEDYVNTGFADGRQRGYGRSFYNMDHDGPNGNYRNR